MIKTLLILVLIGLCMQEVELAGKEGEAGSSSQPSDTGKIRFIKDTIVTLGESLQQVLGLTETTFSQKRLADIDTTYQSSDDEDENGEPVNGEVKEMDRNDERFEETETEVMESCKTMLEDFGDNYEDQRWDLDEAKQRQALAALKAASDSLSNANVNDEDFTKLLDTELPDKYARHINRATGTYYKPASENPPGASSDSSTP